VLFSDAALREDLRKLNQSTNGNKAVMVQRLLNKMSQVIVELLQEQGKILKKEKMLK